MKRRSESLPWTIATGGVNEREPKDFPVESWVLGFQMVTTGFNTELLSKPLSYCYVGVAVSPTGR